MATHVHLNKKNINLLKNKLKKLFFFKKKKQKREGMAGPSLWEWPGHPQPM
jgi:hypothetical protein